MIFQGQAQLLTAPESIKGTHIFIYDLPGDFAKQTTNLKDIVLYGHK